MAVLACCVLASASMSHLGGFAERAEADALPKWCTIAHQERTWHKAPGSPNAAISEQSYSYFTLQPGETMWLERTVRWYGGINAAGVAFKGLVLRRADQSGVLSSWAGAHHDSGYSRQLVDDPEGWTNNGTEPIELVATIEYVGGYAHRGHVAVNTWVHVAGSTKADGDCPVGGADAHEQAGGGDPAGQAADPVNTATGNFFHESRLLPAAAGLDGLDLVGTWNAIEGGGEVASRVERGGLLGDHGTSTFDESLAPLNPADPTSASLAWRRPDGARLLLTPDGAGGWSSPDAVGVVVERDAGAGETVDERLAADRVRIRSLRGVLRTFDGFGRILTVDDPPTGRHFAYCYSALDALSFRLERVVAAPTCGDAGPDIRFSYEVGIVGMPSFVTATSGGRSIRWQFGETDPADPQVLLDANRVVQISSVFAENSQPTWAFRFDWDDQGRIDRVVELRGPGSSDDVVAVDNTYDDVDRVATQVLAGGEEVTFDYSYDALTTRRRTAVTHRSVAGVDAIAATNEEGVVYWHDFDGRLIALDDPSGAQSTRQWQRDRLTQFDSRGGARATATYDADESGGRTPTGVVESVSFPDPVVAGASSTGSTITYCQDSGQGGADPDTRVRRLLDPVGTVTEFGYGPDPIGQPCGGDRVIDRTPSRIVEDPGGRAAVTTVESSAGMATRLVDPDGVVREQGWDPARRVLLFSAVDLDGDDVADSTTWYGYDGDGRRVVVRSPEGWEQWVAYDAVGRLTATFLPVKTTRACPTRGSCSFESGPPPGLIEQRHMTFSHDGRVVAESDAVGADVGYAQCFPATGGSWDVTVGPLVDGVRRRTDLVYDTAGRRRLERVGAATGTVVGGADAVAAAQCGAPPAGSVETAYSYGVSNRLESVSSPEGVVTNFEYDADGRVVKSAVGGATSDVSKAVETVYDLRGRVIERRGPLGDVDAEGDSAQQKVRYTYDDADRVTSVEQVLARDGTAETVLRVWKRYDTAGRRTHEIADLDGDGVGDGDGDGVHDGVTFDPQDRVTETRYTTGGRTLAVGVAQPDVVGLSWNAAGADSWKRWQVYGYDAAGRNVGTWWQATAPTGVTALPAVSTYWDGSFQALNADGEVVATNSTVAAPMWFERSFDPSASQWVERSSSPSPAQPENMAARVSVEDRFDVMGRLVGRSEPFDAAASPTLYSRFGYDLAGRTTWASSPLADAWAADGDPGTDPEHATVRYTYDRDGNRVTRQVWHQSGPGSVPMPVTEGWAYDDDGRMTAHWDAQHWPTREQPGGSPHWSWSYAPGSTRLTTIEDPTGRVGALSYRNDGLVSATTWTFPGAPAVSVVNWFDAAGRRVKRVDDSGMAEWSFDRLGHVVSQVTPAGSSGLRRVDYLWSLAGQPRRMVAPDDAWFMFSHTTDGNLARTDACAVEPSLDPRNPSTPVSACGLWIKTSQHLRSPLLDQVSLPGGQHRSWFKAANRSGVTTRYTQLIDDESNAGGDPSPDGVDTDPVLSDLSLVWRPDGRLGAVMDALGGGTESYTYDPAGQLVSADRPGAADDLGWSWSTRGQRLTGVDGGDAMAYSWSAGGDLAVVSPTSGPARQYEYDAAGRRQRMVSGPLETGWQWDAAGRVQVRVSGAAGCTAAASCGAEQERRYDGDGNLIGVGGPGAGVIAWDPVGPQLGGPPQMLEALVGEGSWAASVRANYGTQRLYVDTGIAGEPSEIAWYAYDHHGSAITTESLDAPSGYDPFGVETDGSGAFGYRGEFRLSADELHLRARSYDPTAGVFLSRDPLDGVDGRPTVGHPSNYVDNDPLGGVDPLGLCRVSDGGYVFGQNAATCDSARDRYHASHDVSKGHQGCAFHSGTTFYNWDPFNQVTYTGGSGCRVGTGGGAYGEWHTCTADGVFGGAASWACNNGDTIADAARTAVTFLPGHDCYDAAQDPGALNVTFCAIDFVPGVGMADEIAGAARWADDLGRVVDDLLPHVDDVIPHVDDVVPHVDDVGKSVDDVGRTADDIGSGRCATTAHSFDADTPVLMANGTTKPIAEIQVGDEVLATDPETGETSSRTVTDTHVMLHDGDLLDLTIEDDDGSGVIFTTDEHRFWSITDQTWVPAIELDEGDQLRQADGTTATVTEVDERDGRQDMWDLTVEVDHSFYVATGGDADDASALVHNQDLCQRVARDIQSRIGGKIYRVGNDSGKWPMGSTHPGANASEWRYHEFVVKDGKVWDQWTDGMALDEYIKYFPGWSVDDLIHVAG